MIMNWVNNYPKEVAKELILKQCELDAKENENKNKILEFEKELDAKENKNKILEMELEKVQKEFAQVAATTGQLRVRGSIGKTLLCEEEGRWD